MKTSKLITFIILIASLSIYSCSGSGKKATYRIEKANFTLEAPLFSGANSTQAEHTLDLSAIKKELGLDEGEVKSAKLTKATIYFQDSASTDLANSIVMSLSGDNVNMAQLAVANPLEAGKKEVVLTGSSEAEIAAFFNQTMMYIVLDVDLKNDSQSPVMLSADLEFELEF